MLRELLCSECYERPMRHSLGLERFSRPLMTGHELREATAATEMKRRMIESVLSALFSQKGAVILTAELAAALVKYAVQAKTYCQFHHDWVRIEQSNASAIDCGSLPSMTNLVDFGTSKEFVCSPASVLQVCSTHNHSDFIERNTPPVLCEDWGQQLLLVVTNIAAQLDIVTMFSFVVCCPFIGRQKEL